MPIKIQRQFDGGLGNDERENSGNSCTLIKHFDTSKPNRLTPYRDMENEAGSLSAYAIKSVALCTASGGTQTLHALGNVSGQTYPQFLEKPANDMVAGTFAVSTNGADTSGTVIGNSLLAYKSKLQAMKTSGTHTVVINYNPETNVLATTGTITTQSSVGVYPQPFRHPQDDIVYFGAGNVIATLNDTTFTASALTLPSDLIITSLTDYGVYLAIACAPKNTGEKSYVFLWGRDTSLTTVAEVVDFGEGKLMILDNVGGTLVGISGISFDTASTFDITPRIVSRAYTGGIARVFHEIRSENASQTLRNYKAKSRDGLYFAASTNLEGETVNQTWVCKKNAGGFLVIQPDRLVNNDTALTGYVDGLSIVGDYIWVAFNGDGSLKRTSDTATYTATAQYDTLINPGMELADKTRNKELVAVSLSFAPLASGASATLLYSVDGGAYTEILTETTDGAITKEAKKEADGKTPIRGREFQFRVKSTAAEITELKYEYRTMKTLID